MARPSEGGAEAPPFGWSELCEEDPEREGWCAYHAADHEADGGPLASGRAHEEASGGAHEEVAKVIAAALYVADERNLDTEPEVEEDARDVPSRFRVELPWLDGHTYYAVIFRDDEERLA